MKKALIIIAMVAIIAIAGSMIYYFVFFRPGIAKAELALQEQKLESDKISKVKEYLGEYNAIRQEFIDKLESGTLQDNTFPELKEIRIKLIRLYAPEGADKYNNVISSCLIAMNEIISDLQTIRNTLTPDNINDNKIKELTGRFEKNLNIVKNSAINY